MKMNLLRAFGTHHRFIFVMLVLALFLLIPSGDMLADSNAPTVTNTPAVTDTPIPELPTETPATGAAATNTPFLILPTEVDEGQGAIAIATPPSGSTGGLSTINRILLMILGISVVVIVGVIVYIFINQTRGGLGER
jgi:hypothetical protein